MNTSSIIVFNFVNRHKKTSEQVGDNFPNCIRCSIEDEISNFAFANWPILLACGANSTMVCL